MLKQRAGTMPAGLPAANWRIRAAGKTDVGSGRLRNDDYLAILYDLFVVADGIGGHDSGAVPARIVVESIVRSFRTGRGSPQVRLLDALHVANQDVLAVRGSCPERTVVQSTCACAAVDRGHLVVAHVGDSRLYRLRDGDLERLTRDHSFREEYPEVGVDLRDSYRAGGSAVTRALGLGGTVVPELAVHAMSAADRYLLCTDGLTNTIDHDALRNVLVTCARPDVACHGLLREAHQLGTRDDIAVIVFDVREG